MPPVRSLLQTHHWLQRLRSQLHFLVSLCSEESMPKGGALLAHLYDQVPLVSRTDLSYVLYYIIQSCCTIYFKFLKKWIFEGVGSDSSSKFFIESCPVSEMSFNRKFWTRNFVLNRMLVPGFVKGLENDLLICGKSMALLRLCAPNLTRSIARSKFGRVGFSQMKFVSTMLTTRPAFILSCISAVLNTFHGGGT
ncbi:Gamma-tubulin complex component 6 [Homalodisca vitripennis]|nr:Gamma-tubulin complex component 6 [Homalodisca vitripennis]